MRTFDIDGTLLDYAAAPGSDPLINESLIATLAEGEQIALVTNQGGLAFGTTRDNTKFPHPADFVWRLTKLVNYLTDRGIVVNSVHVCTFHPKAPPNKCDEAAAAIAEMIPSSLLFVSSDALWRKPNRTMLLDAGATLYYGDSDEDKEAAANFDIPFVQVERFTRDGGGQPLNLTTCVKCGRTDKVIVSDSERWCMECGRNRVVWIAPSLTGECPPFNSQLWMAHEPFYDYDDDALMLADWAEEMHMGADDNGGVVWIKDKLDDEAPGRRFEIYAEQVLTWFATELLT